MPIQRFAPTFFSTSDAITFEKDLNLVERRKVRCLSNGATRANMWKLRSRCPLVVQEREGCPPPPLAVWRATPRRIETTSRIEPRLRSCAGEFLAVSRPHPVPTSDVSAAEFARDNTNFFVDG